MHIDSHIINIIIINKKKESGKKISSKLYKKSKEQVTVHIPVQKADVPAYSETKI